MKKIGFLLISGLILLMVGLGYSQIGNGIVDGGGYTRVETDALLAVYCLESVFGTAIEADDLELSGTTLQTAAEIPHIDVAETITGAWTLPYEKYKKWTSAPTGTDLVAGQRYRADGITWNPGGLSGSPVPAHDVICSETSGPTWILDRDEDGNKYVKSISLPTMLASELNDISDPHLLTASELKGTIITNSESTGADEWDFPARSEGWNFIFVKEADQNIALDPNGSENWYFRTTTAAYVLNGAGTSLINTTAGKSTITCFSTETSVFCTGDANWAQGS